MTPQTRQLRCSCCGEDAGRWTQFHNQDTGYGLCGRCATRIANHRPFGHVEPPSQAEMDRTWGLEGVHRAYAEV